MLFNLCPYELYWIKSERAVRIRKTLVFSKVLLQNSLVKNSTLNSFFYSYFYRFVIEYKVSFAPNTVSRLSILTFLQFVLPRINPYVSKLILCIINYHNLPSCGFGSTKSKKQHHSFLCDSR